jgi:hypothetical protein
LFLVCSVSLKAQIKKICDVPSIPEISGTVWVNNQLWVHNDGGNAPILYRIDTATGKAIDSTTFSGVSNVDWEDLAANNTHIFIGDFGNNYGDRKNLKIYKFPITDLGKKQVVCDTISFYYPLQNTYNSNPLTNFDCEALVALDDSLILFSKSIGDATCRIYSLPIENGRYAAKWTDSLELNYWITGASRMNNIVCLTGYGYNGDLVPKMRMGYFNQGKMSRIGAMEFTPTYTGPLQIESCVLFPDGMLWFSAEESNGYQAQLMSFKVENFLQTKTPANSDIAIYPNPGNGCIRMAISEKFVGGRFQVLNTSGKSVLSKKINAAETEFCLPKGNYVVTAYHKRKKASSKIVME